MPGDRLATSGTATIYPTKVAPYFKLRITLATKPLDAALLHNDNITVQEYPAIELAMLGDPSEATNTLLIALDMAIRPRTRQQPKPA
jgi:hypothetical protein